MAEKLRDGISRELRYMEYKLRKRKSDKNKKKHSSPGMEPTSTSIPEDFKRDLPTNHGEEDLQLEVRYLACTFNCFKHELNKMKCFMTCGSEINFFLRSMLSTVLSIYTVEKLQPSYICSVHRAPLLISSGSLRT